jgi:hypothetical protein
LFGILCAAKLSNQSTHNLSGYAFIFEKGNHCFSSVPPRETPSFRAEQLASVAIVIENRVNDYQII